MNHPSRRQLLAGFLGGLAQAAGSVVLARTVLAGEAGEANESSTSGQGTLQQRAERLAARQGPLDANADNQLAAFINGGFRNGGFANGGGYGGFRKGGFANGGGGYGGFRNGGFANGGGGGGFRNGGFANGGGGFRNGAFRNF